MIDIKNILPEKEFSIDRDSFGKIVRINVNKIKDISKVPGIKNVYPTNPDPDQTEKHHGVISNMKDIEGNGNIYVFRALLDKPYTRVACFDEKGNQVWISKKIAPGADDESGMPVVDLNGDGKYELILSQWAKLYCIDAHTGKIKWARELEKGGKPGPGNWDCPMVVGHFTDCKKKAIVVRAGLNIHCFDPEGKEVWNYSLKGKTYGHCICRYDVDKDGLDEIYSSRNGTINALSPDGKTLWLDKKQKNHSDNFTFGDIDEDGDCEVVYDHDGCGGKGPLYVVDGINGKLKFIIDYNKEGLKHCQGFKMGNFCPELPGLEVAIVGKDDKLLLFNNQGKLLWKHDIPTGLVTRADWNGDGVQEILVFAVGYQLDPCWSVWNGKGERLFAMSFLPAPGRSHAGMCGPGLGFDGFSDLDGNGKADILVAYGPWKTGSPQYQFIAEAPDNF